MKKKKPIHKFNGGLGATLCHSCSVIINTGLTDDLYCDKCLEKKVNSEIYINNQPNQKWKTTWKINYQNINSEWSYYGQVLVLLY